MTAAPLAVHNAEIRTATVEIKTLTVSGKQVTLAVFRQLQERDLVDREFNLNGEPWGTVNYHPGKTCGTTHPHLHVVWQEGSDLRRATLQKPICAVEDDIWDQGAADWLESAVLNGWRPAGTEEQTRRNGLRIKFNTGTLEVRGSQIHRTVYSTLWPPLEDWGRYVFGRGEREESPEARIGRWREEVADELRSRVASRAAADGLDHHGLFERLESSLAAVTAKRAREHEVWRRVRDMPQLFIAV